MRVIAGAAVPQHPVAVVRQVGADIGRAHLQGLADRGPAEDRGDRHMDAGIWAGTTEISVIWRMASSSTVSMPQ